jgi:hypothetical protein
MLGVVCGDIEKRAIRGYSKIGICGSALQPVKAARWFSHRSRPYTANGTVSLLTQDSGCEISRAFEGAKL